MANIRTAEVLREIASIYSEADRRRLPVPTHIELPFKRRLYTTYRRSLEIEGIDPDKIGYILGNSTRWKSEFCKFFALNFMQFMMSKARRSTFDPNLLTAQFTDPNADTEVWLRSYKVHDFSPQYVTNGPTLFLGDSRTIAIKAKVQFPNVKKAREMRNRNQYMPKWLNLRYELLRSGGVKLLPFPKFVAERVAESNTYTTRGLVSNLPGEICKFSYCQLSSAIKDLGNACLESFVTGSADILSFDRISLVIHLISLIQGRNTTYNLVYSTTSSEAQRSLFDMDTEAYAPLSARSNGVSALDGMHIYAGSLESIEGILEAGIDSFVSLVASSFDFNRDNIYYNEDVEGDDEDLYILLFKTQDKPFAIGDKRAVWFQAPEIEEYDLMTEDEFTRLMGR